MPSIGAGRRRDRVPRPSAAETIKPERTPKPEAARRRAAADLAEAIETLEEGLPPLGERTEEDPGIEDPPDPEAYDLHEYEEDGPFRDEDASGDPLEEEGLLDASEGDPDGPFPTPRVILDVTGDVMIPVEAPLQRALARPDAHGPDLLRKWEGARLLRQVAERMVREWRKILLDPERTIADLPPTSQAEFAKRSGIADKTRLNRIVATTFVATPYWGLAPMTAFFREREAREGAWEKVLEEALSLIRTEDPEYPMDPKTLWEKVRHALQAAGFPPPGNDRMLRNRLNERGVPAARARRKEIYTKVKNCWETSGRPHSLPRSDIPGIREKLLQSYGLFSSSDARECRDPAFVPFVEERIAKVLEDLKVRWTP